MVNFAVKEQGLTSQLLSIVVRKERPQLEIMKDNLVLTIAKNKKVLVRTLYVGLCHIFSIPKILIFKNTNFIFMFYWKSKYFVRVLTSCLPFKGYYG